MNDIDRHYRIFQHDHSQRLKRAELRRQVISKAARQSQSRQWSQMLFMFFF